MPHCCWVMFQVGFSCLNYSVMRTGVNLFVFGFYSDALNQIIADEIETAGALIVCMLIYKGTKSVRIISKANNVNLWTY